MMLNYSRGQKTFSKFSQVIAWTKSLGKVPVTAKDKPGFIVNRIIVPFTAEAVRMLERGLITLKARKPVKMELLNLFT